ncbi:MAG: hypothetical protein KDD48_00475 [Bdellovibrionales bacterium]|nr:hypothetical protein [Bdellovibrionales bacterium]
MEKKSSALSDKYERMINLDEYINYIQEHVNELIHTTDNDEFYNSVILGDYCDIQDVTPQ